MNKDIIIRSSLIMNFVTLILILFFYYVELTRENFAVKYLDVNHSKPNNNLDTEVENYPEIKQRIKNINKKYHTYFLVSLLFTFINSIYSTVVIYSRYQNISTITAYSSYIILLANKYYSSYNIATKSLKKERVYSAYLTTKITYNTIDTDFVHPTPVSTPLQQNTSNVM